MKRTTSSLLLALAVVTCRADFAYSDFTSLNSLQLNGTAQQVGGIVRMTADQVSDQAGNMWHTNLQSVGLGFSTKFQFRCDGEGQAPADGMAFGIQAAETTALGNSGGDNAMAGLPGSLVVNFQSFWNRVQLIGTDSDGNVVYFHDVEFIGLHRPEAWTAQVDYDAGTSNWTVSLDNSVVLSGAFDLGQAVTLVNGTDAYLGLGAGTGLGFDNNDALSWQTQVVPEPASLLVFGLGVAALRTRRR